MAVLLELKVNDVEIKQFLPLISVESFDPCKKLDMLLCCKLIIDRIELRTDSNSGKDFVDGTIDLMAIEKDRSMCLRNSGCENIEGC